MSGNSHKFSFLFVPILFLVLSYLIIFLILHPFFGAISSTTDFLFYDKPQSSGQLKDIFTSTPATSQKRIRLSTITFPVYGTRFGQLEIPAAAIKADLYFGDGTEELNNGVGIYNGSFIPGYGRTILVAGHNHTFFHTLGNAKTGDSIKIGTNYGEYVYKITKAQVHSVNDRTAYDINANKENLILYTCYPFNCIGLTQQRYYVYAEYVSGPEIDKQG